jgi:hypothetical protein
MCSRFVLCWLLVQFIRELIEEREYDYFVCDTHDLQSECFSDGIGCGVR